MEQNKKHHFWDPLVSRFKRHGESFGHESTTPSAHSSRHEAHTRKSIGVDEASSEKPFTEPNDR